MKWFCEQIFEQTVVIFGDAFRDADIMGWIFDTYHVYGVVHGGVNGILDHDTSLVVGGVCITPTH